jgi:hypothetical protein
MRRPPERRTLPATSTTGDAMTGEPPFFALGAHDAERGRAFCAALS